MRCEDVMRRDVTCLLPQEAALSAAERMRDENLGFLPVCDDQRRVLGTLTDRDLVVRLLACGLSPRTPVQEVMTRDAVTCRPRDDLATAEELMARLQKARLLVVDGDGKLVGVISLSDLAQAANGEEVAETLRHVTAREVHCL